HGGYHPGDGHGLLRDRGAGRRGWRLDPPAREPDRAWIAHRGGGVAVLPGPDLGPRRPRVLRGGRDAPLGPRARAERRGSDPRDGVAQNRTTEKQARAIQRGPVFFSRNSLPMLRLRLVVGGKILGATLQQDRAGRLANQLLGNAAKRPALVPALAT